jgi:hypothetical protein
MVTATFTLIGVFFGFIGGCAVGNYYFRLGMAQSGGKEPKVPLVIDPIQAFFTEKKDEKPPEEMISAVQELYDDLFSTRKVGDS